ncbi:anti-sigma factor [Nocardioides gilvus]|uniref:anti-sigma factor n=1 Tax=Nocardioides gilvus TaxID=1735589 RepID=UPI000D740C17|nr:anti-sigma factor [Nocardioides gilvus]
MSAHDGPPSGPHAAEELLAALAMGEGPEEVDETTRSHVAACDFCTSEVAALRETLALVVAAGAETFTAPPASVWAAVSAGLGAETSEPAPPAPRVAAHGPSGAESAQLTDPSDAVVTPLTRRRAPVPVWLAATAAAVALAAGVGIGTQVVGDPEESGPSVQVLGSTELASLDDSPQARGSAQVQRRDDRVVLRVEPSDLDGPEGTREVWLINTDGSRMVSLGLLAAGDAGEFDFPERLLEQGYRIVDISYEPDDGDPTHSGQSLARGTIDG